MKKFYYISGTRDGGLWEMEQGSRERGPERVHLSASNREKADLYKIYQFIDSKIVRTLATLTTTGKTRIVLLPDDILDELNMFVRSSAYSHICWIFHNNPNVYVDLSLELDEKRAKCRIIKCFSRYMAKIKYSNATNDVSTIVVPFSEGLRHFINEIVFSWQEIYGELTHNEFCRLIPEPELLIEKINFLPNVHNCEDARAVLEVIE